MSTRLRDTAVVAIVTAAIVGGLSLLLMRMGGDAAAAAVAEPRRAADGKPDFSGIWQANNGANWDLQTHAARPMVAQENPFPAEPVLAAPAVAFGAIGWVPPDVGVVEGDEIPYQPWAAKRKQENFANWVDRDPELKCYLPGIPRAMYMPYKFQIVQGTTKIMMVYEFRGADRTIHLDTVDPYPGDAFMGHSVGKWEGDTLVVNVNSFTASTWFDRAGNFHSAALKVVERFTPLSPDAFMYEATMDDPKVFTRPWKIKMPIYRRLEPNAQMMEFRCAEMVEETLYGHLRKEPLVKRWEGKTMVVSVERRIPPGETVYELHTDGNPPEGN
jgi:hypothetical protein